MTTSIDALRIRRVMGREEWLAPEPFGPDGWSLISRDNTASIIVTAASIDGAEWVHASMTRPNEIPSYEDMCRLHRAVFDGYAYEVHAPASQHVNIHAHALHLWGRRDGAPVLPEFGLAGSI